MPSYGPHSKSLDIVITVASIERLLDAGLAGNSQALRRGELLTRLSGGVCNPGTSVVMGSSTTWSTTTLPVQ